MSSVKSKTVYILGAGFSMEAKAPSQERLVEKIFETYSACPDIISEDDIKNFKTFLSDDLQIPEAMHSRVPLEDIFTPLDRCLADRTAFRNLSVDSVKKIRELIYNLIGLTLNHLLSGPSPAYIEKFAELVTESASKRGSNKYRDVDPISIISTNWDILLDNAIKKKLDDNWPQKSVVDYCCYISSHDENDKSVIPGLEMLGMGGFNVKLLKLHGSLNWLQCPRCMRVYVAFNRKTAVEQMWNRDQCRHCNKHFGKSESHTLGSNLIMPTFLKDLTNPQYKLIWQNAGVEIAEATKLVFIGYSLPQADFEMRQVLSRMTKDSAEVEVVDYDDGTPKTEALKERFKVFFGKREPRFYLEGASQYILSL